MITRESPDYPAALLAWLNDERIVFRAPPVCTVAWDDASWIRYIDWAAPPNARALAEAQAQLAEARARGARTAQFYADRYQTTPVEYPIRYVVTFINRDGMRALAHAAEGQHTYATATEAHRWILAARRNNSADTLRSVYGAADPDTLEVRPCACYPGHWDPVGVYFDN